MAEFVSCPSCKARLKVPDDMVGRARVVKCPKCAHSISLAGVGAASSDEDDDHLETDEDEARARPRKAARERRDDEEDEDRPRARKKRPRDEDEDEEDDERPARRKARKAKKKSGGSLGLIIGLAAGACVLLLIGCGVGAYFLFSRGGLAGMVDNPAVTEANFEKVQTGMTLQAVEAIFGAGGACSDADAKAAILGPGPFGLDDLQKGIADDPKAYGLTGWYRWKNGPTTMLIGVDNAKQVRVAGLYTVTAKGSSRSWKANVNRVGGAPGGVPPRPGRGR